jgi:transcriptional regulator with XRE-family HTH domain
MFNYASRRGALPASQQKNEAGRTINGVPPIQELGAMLRKRREAMGATLAEVEAATKIRQKYLAALEADEWQLLPGEVVGRGFLRNYATYLGLDQTELVERRRTVADPGLANLLSGTSAGSALPPPRQVDYRPKEVPLLDEDVGIEQRREIRWTPFLTGLGVVLGLLLLAWTIRALGGPISAGLAGLVEGVQGLAESAFAPPPTATPTQVPQLAQSGSNDVTAMSTLTPTLIADNQPVVDTALAPTATATVAAVDASMLIPTPTPDAPVATPVPLPTETPTPLPTDTPPAPTETPTETPSPTAPPVLPPVCVDAARTALTSPGENQVVAGDVAVTGRATHEAFQYYKLEFAPGANAAEGFIYFAGANTAVDGGQLGTFSSGSVPNGSYTLRLTVVDLTGNFPPTCQVTILVQN